MGDFASVEDNRVRHLAWALLILSIAQSPIDLLAILQKSLDRAIFLYILMRKVRLNGVGASITIVHIRKFYKL